MREHAEQSLGQALKADVAEAAALYFAPVRAVVREFSKAIANGADRKKPGEFTAKNA